MCDLVARVYQVSLQVGRPSLSPEVELHSMHERHIIPPCRRQGITRPDRLDNCNGPHQADDGSDKPVSDRVRTSHSRETEYPHLMLNVSKEMERISLLLSFCQPDSDPGF